MSKTKVFLPMLALLLCMGAFLFPVTAHAQSNEDTTPPTVTAVVSGEMLNITAKDDVGVAAVYINGTRFSTLANGTASIYLKDYAGTGAQVEVYATDTSGNRSQSVFVSNPYYQAPTPAPTSSAPTTTSTPAPTSQPTTTPTPTSTPDTSTPAPSSSDGDDTDAPGDGGTGTDGAIGTGDNVTTPGGTGTVTEIATDEDGKLFYTIETPAGNVFYLVIDMARTDGNNVYFLNAVTEADLAALAETDGSTTGGAGAIPDPAPDLEPTPDPEPEPTPDPEPEETSGGNTGALIFIILAVIAVGGAGYYFKILKPRKQAAMQDDTEYEDEDFGEVGDDTDAEFLFADEDDAYYTDDDGEADKETFDNE
ncbi:MAG: DUF4366 domain-containing protein [Christensenellaceae bacterium]|jgi:preprotein translocase subunit YajC|nr:DUF4366 domain-containing protein [Christensenellaceae bacterium]